MPSLARMPYLFNADGTLATRPAITQAPTVATYGQSITVQAPAPSAVSKATWISLSSVTQSFNQNQRALPLTFSVGDTSALSVIAPARAALAPPGYYLLFIIDSRRMQSIVRIA